MSNILMVFLQPILDNNKLDGLICFYDGFVAELRKNGNNVKAINLHQLEHIDEACIYDIKNFKPDIVFTFNNRITEDIIKNTDCPICVMDADGINFWTNKDLIKKYADRYFLFTFWDGWEQSEYIKLGFQEKQIASLHLATSVLAKDTPKTANISFIGSVFTGLSNNVIENISDEYNLKKEALDILCNGTIDLEDFYAKHKDVFDNNIINCYPLFDPRLNVLQSILDLGLDLYGVNWDKLPQEYLLLQSAYKKQPVFTLADNERVYNASRVNISISHPQCKGYAFPWRCFDIMASNGLLISSYSGLLEKMTHGHVKIPMYKSPFDVRDMCKYALDNPAYCQDIISASNAYVDKYARWHDNLQKIQETINVNIVATTVIEKGALDVVTVMSKKMAQEITKPIKIKNKIVSGNTNKVKYFFAHLGIHKRIKIFCYATLLLLAQIPILDLLQRSNRRLSLKRKIEKWWR